MLYRLELQDDYELGRTRKEAILGYFKVTSPFASQDWRKSRQNSVCMSGLRALWNGTPSTPEMKHW